MATINQRLELFFQNYPVRRFANKSIIIEAGAEPSGVYFLESGQVRQFIISKEGEELTLHVFETGAYFPMTWVMNNIPNRHSYEAMGETLVRIAPAVDFQQFIINEPEILFHLAQRLLHGLNGMLLRVESLSLQSARVRIISILLYLGRHFGQHRGQEIIFPPGFTHRFIATFTGLARETTSVEISKLEKEGFLKYRGSSLVILDVANLEKLLAE